MSEQEPSRRGLVLIGARGTGKSTVGRIVAQELGRPFLDADDELEARAGKTIRAIFDDEGEPAFRDLEERVLAELTTVDGAVIATGGGVVLRESNRRRLREFGLVVWLTAQPEVLAKRIQADHHGVSARPSLTSQGTLAELTTILAARTPLYREVADAMVDTAARSAADVARTVVEICSNRGFIPASPKDTMN